MSLLRDLNFELFVAGTGSQQVQARLQAIITEKSLGQHVHLLGFVKNIPSVICDADFGIIPSVARESFSLAGIEYMSQGRCVIATNHGGQVEYIEEGVTGLLVPLMMLMRWQPLSDGWWSIETFANRWVNKVSVSS